jgi:hypothetical protein
MSTVTAESAVYEAMRSQDPAVLAYIGQMTRYVRPHWDLALPILSVLLKNENPDIRWVSALALGNYGSVGKQAAPIVISAICDRKGSYVLRSSFFHTLLKTGSDEPSAKRLLDFPLDEDKALLALAFRVLLEYPDHALKFMRERPNFLTALENEPRSLFKVVQSSSDSCKALIKELLDRPDVPVSVLAWTGERRFLDRIRQSMRAAGPHLQSFLRACERACGEPPNQVIEISEIEGSRFRPASAWPGSDESRKEFPNTEHSDGFTDVLITGSVLLEDGTPAVEPIFVRTNDSLLLGQRIESREMVRYYPETGRFVALLRVFAAYSSVGGRVTKNGPYQTGSARLRVEAKGAKSLLVQIYDEMPEVKFVLSASK